MEFRSDESISCGVSWTNFMVQASLYWQEKVMFLLYPICLELMRALTEFIDVLLHN